MSKVARILDELRNDSVGSPVELILRQCYDVFGIGELEAELIERISEYVARLKTSYQRIADVPTLLVNTHKFHMTLETQGLSTYGNSTVERNLYALCT